MSGLRRAGGLSVALGTVLLVDVLRVFLPSVITIFGRAAETPAELLGAFGLLWFVLPLGAPLLARRVGSGRVLLAAALVLAAARLVLQVAGGGRPQLWTAAVGLTAGLVWLGQVATRGTRADLRGLVLGLALGTVLHGTLGAEELVWRSGWLPVLAVLVLVAGFVAAAVAQPAGGPPVGGRVWPLALPAVLLWGVLSGSPAVASVAVSYAAGAAEGLDGVASSTGVPGVIGTLAVKGLAAAAVAAFVGAALAPPSPALRWAAAVALPLGVLLAVAGDPVALPAAMLLGAAGLGGCLAAAAAGEPGSRTRRGWSPVLGGIGMAVAAVLYYAAYDLGYPNEPVLVAVAAAVALAAVTTRPAATPAVPAVSAGPAEPAVPAGPAEPAAPAVPAVSAVPAEPVVPGVPAEPGWRWAAVAGVAALLLVDGGRWGPVDPPADPAGELRVVAYNVRMGFGLDGRFDPDALAAVVAGQRPDVVLLSEVDRGWLLNGGHDDLAVLARRLGLPTLFAPAADSVWGDALLTRLPVVSARTVVLPAVGAPTGAQALGAVLRVGSREVAVVSTHLQPPPDGGPVEQARSVGALARELGTGGRPVVVGGDLNTEPADPAFRVLLDAGLTDALAAARPLPSSPADDPVREIDHVLVTPGITAAGAVAPRSTASDHLAVAVTLRLPGQGS
jgi:endonuclease/exonuclease/phosphatase family metal-dependent hydrolase